MAHPGDKGRCLLDGYLECAAKIDAACICEKMPADVARMYYRRKYGKMDEENKPSNLITALLSRNRHGRQSRCRTNPQTV